MWLFTVDGFYSVVTGGEFGEELMVRARDSADLDRLRDNFFPDLGPNVELPGRDYPVRAFATREGLAQCLTRIALSLDYSNFKSAVGAQRGHGRARIYSKVWSDCLAIERG
jgi:hypothetical protein